MTTPPPSDASAPAGDPVPAVHAEPFGTTQKGEDVHIYTLTNGQGVEARIINYGGILLSLSVPDRDGRCDDVVLGYDDLASYEEASPYFGALIGRYANRICGGRFELDGQSYRLAVNNGPNHLHGGRVGFDKVVWHADPFVDAEQAGIVFSYTSPAHEEGYPGTLESRVTYRLTRGNQLILDYRATTDQATPVNLTHHSYFNLAGNGSGDVLDHRVRINARHFTPVDETLIPTGEIRPVRGTPFDFTTMKAIGAELDANDVQLEHALGYDHNFVLDGTDGATPTLAARVYEPASGRVMEVFTTEPGLQFYSGNVLDGTLTGKGEAVYGQHAGFALETQHFPDSPNQPDFPSTILRPAETYRTRTVYCFSTRTD